jgi:hypothetical protein
MACKCGAGKKAVKFEVTKKDGTSQVVDTRQKAIALVRSNPGSKWRQIPR